MHIAILTFDGFNELDSLIAPVGEKDDYVARALDNIPPYLSVDASGARLSAN